jgi:hypothetical protein
MQLQKRKEYIIITATGKFQCRYVKTEQNRWSGKSYLVFIFENEQTNKICSDDVLEIELA